MDPTQGHSPHPRLQPLTQPHCSLCRLCRPKNGTHLTAGGTRQLTESTRLRGKWGTQGILALALEVAGEKSSLTLVSEVHSSGALNPKFGATLNLSP